MGKVLQFKSCAVGGEFTGFGRTPSSYYYTRPDNTADFPTTVINTYKDDKYLSGKVTGIGCGWQQYTVPNSGKVKFTVRGAAGGSTGSGTINSVTGDCAGSINKPRKRC